SSGHANAGPDPRSPDPVAWHPPPWVDPPDDAHWHPHSPCPPATRRDRTIRAHSLASLSALRAPSLRRHPSRGPTAHRSTVSRCPGGLAHAACQKPNEKSAPTRQKHDDLSLSRPQP